MAKYRRTSMRKSKKAYRRNKKLVPKAVRRYVRGYIARQAENKFVITRAVNQPITTAVGTTPYAVSLLPSLAVGSTRYQRSANQIKVRKLTISGRVNLLPYNVTTNPLACPVAVKIWILSVTSYREIGAFSGSAAATGFFNDTIAPTGFAGNVLDLITPVSDDFKVYAQKTIYLGCTGATNNFPSTSVGAYDNSKFSAGFYFDVTKHIKSKLQYNDTSSSSIPQNKNMWIVMQPVDLFGNSTGSVQCETHHVINCLWEDY